MTALSGTVTPTRRLFCVISTARCHRVGGFSSSWRESVSLSLEKATGSEYKARSVKWMKYFRIRRAKGCSFCVCVQRRAAQPLQNQTAESILYVFHQEYLIKQSSLLGTILFVSSSDRLSRETSGTVPSVWPGCAARASLQTQGHQALRRAEALCSCPAPTSSTSHVWKPLKPLAPRADHPAPCADLCTIKNFSKEVRWLMGAKNHLLRNQTAPIPESQRECRLASSVTFHNSKLFFCHRVVVNMS